MKFIVSTGVLLKELQQLSGVISSNTVLPILEDFLFEIKEGRMTIFSTDLETSMSTVVDVEAKEEGRIAIPAKILIETLKTLPEQPITFSFDEENYAIEITSESGKYKLVGENPEDFPKIPVKEDVQSVNMPTEVLSRAVANTLFAVSNDELRPAMTGVLFQIGADGLTFVSTDAHKLVRYRRKEVTGESANFIVPKKALALLKSTLPGDDTPVEVAYNSSNAFFEFGDLRLICRLVDAKYPDYNAVIPADNTNILVIGRRELQNTLRRISIFSNKTTHQVVLNLNGSELKISAQDLDFSNEANERLACSYEGPDLEIGFNARFLIEMLGVLETEEIRMELSTPTRAGTIFPTSGDENEELLMLVMPVMLNA